MLIRVVSEYNQVNYKIGVLDGVHDVFNHGITHGYDTVYWTTIDDSYFKPTHTFEHFYRCIPPKTTAQQHKRIFRNKSGRMFLGTDKKGRATESELASIFMSRQPPKDFPRDKPLAVEIEFRYPYKKSEKKSVVKDGLVIPHTSRPDLDNLCKGCADVLTRCGFWNDDSQVHKITLSKAYCSAPGIYLKIRA